MGSRKGHGKGSVRILWAGRILARRHCCRYIESIVPTGEGSMGQLLVRKVDDDLIRRLKERAAVAGRSAEASIGDSRGGVAPGQAQLCRARPPASRGPAGPRAQRQR